MIMRLMCDHRNLDNEQVAMLYNVVAEKLGWQPITASAIKLWRERYDLETAGGRLGSKEFYNQRSMQNRRSAPTAPLNMWSLDGWDVELYYQKTTTKGGKSVTTYNNRLTVVVVLDPFNKYPVGYAIGERECAELITEAMRNAANHTAELFGQRYRAHQIQSDHYAMKAMTPIYSVSGDRVTPARVGNAKAKPIERYFLTLNKTYCQLMPNWSGFGITSNKNLQPNSDALNMLRKSFPDLKLALVPRHAERGDDITEMLKKSGFTFVRRSAGTFPEEKADILLADSTGEMTQFMKDADIVVMGKSFAGHDEGHNLIEPAMLRKAVVTGPVLRNFRYLLNVLKEAQAVVTATDEELTGVLHRLIGDTAERRTLGDRAFRTIGANGGAADRAIDALEAALKK